MDTRIAELARRQLGLVTSAQLAALGLDTSAVSKRVRRGVLHRVHHGVYSLSPALSHEARRLAAVLAAGQGAGLGHFAAANHWNLRRSPLITVVSPRRCRVRGVVAYRRDLDPRDLTTYRGIPVTTVARTFVDLTDFQTPHQLANVMHEAAFRRRFDPAATRAAMNRAQGHRGLPILERALALNQAGSRGTKSPNEDAFLALVAAAGYPEPLVNVVHLVEELDFRWPDRRLVVEVDGGHHERPRAQAGDERRDALLTAAGYRVLRVADVELAQRPDAVLSALARAW